MQVARLIARNPLASSMKTLALLGSVALLATACQRHDAAPTPAEDPNWLKLEIPTDWTAGDQAYSIIGNIDDTLLVATNVKVYRTTDHGKTWQVSHTFNGAVWGLLSRHDTIFALTSYTTNSQGERLFATVADKYTVDFGTTWAYTVGVLPYSTARGTRLPIGRVGASGITYQLKANTQPIAGSSSRLVVASDLLRTGANGPQPLRLPGRHYLNNLYLDAQNRLYVAASGLAFDEATGQAIESTQQKTALVYISRQPLP